MSSRAPHSGACMVAGLVALTVLPGRMASARVPPLQPCADARYVVQPGPGDPPLLPDRSAGIEVVVIEQGRVSITSGCGPVAPRTYRADRRGTRLVASWPVCGTTRRVRLNARVVDGCLAMTGSRTIGRSRARRFIAVVSTCSDGIVDPGRGEECDGGPACTDDCRRRRSVTPSTTSTSTSTSTTTTSSTSSTESSACLAVCGNGTIDPECNETCDGAVPPDAVCPTGAVDGCPVCTDCRIDFACCPTTTVTTSTSTSVTTTSSTSSTSSTLAVPVSYAGDVAPILVNTCAGASCHSGNSPQQGMNLATARKAYTALVNVFSGECAGVLRVSPGAPDASYLLSKLTNSGPCTPTTRMPLDANPLSPAQIKIIRAWIAQGAQQN